MYKVIACMYCVVQVGRLPPPCGARVGTSLFCYSKMRAIPTVGTTSDAITPRVGATSAVMSPPLPHRGVVDDQFEPHIIRDLVENGIEILFSAKEGEFNPMTFTNKRSRKKANYGVIRRFYTPNNDLTPFTADDEISRHIM